MTTAIELFRHMSDGRNSINDIAQVLFATGNYTQADVDDALQQMNNDPGYQVEVRHYRVFHVPVGMEP